MSQLWVALGAISALISVAMGAFGAHGLEGKLDARSMAVFHTAAQYEMYHSLALIALGLWAARNPQSLGAPLPGWAFTIGTVLFCGSLYALALSGIRILGAITPFGGVAFLIGWGSFAFLALKA